MATITTEDLATWDECPRKQLFSLYEPPRLSIATVLNESLRVGLLAGSPIDARNHLMSRAASPGLAITADDIYSAACHHAALIEIIVAYLLTGEGAWLPAPTATLGNHTYQPLSYLMPDHRLRRIVLASRWDKQRELEELHSWRTVGDVAATGRPMLINAITIGQATKGFRWTVWTRGFSHRTSKTIRVRRLKEDAEFDSAWRRISRESSSKSVNDWLGFMQSDNAFEGVVNSARVDNVAESTKGELPRTLDKVAEGEDLPRRSQCFKLSPCPFAKLCYASPPTSPWLMGWQQKAPS